MAIQRSSIKTGPAIAIYGGGSFYFKSGLTITESIETFDINVDNFGLVDKRAKDRKITIKGTPAGEWESLPILLPWLESAIGTRIHGDADVPLVIHAVDGTKFTYHNARITKMPGLKFATTETLIKDVEWTARVKNNTEPTAAAALFTRETAAFTDASFSSAAILTQPYTLNWGDAPWDAFKTIDGVEVDFNLSLADVPVDGYGIIDQFIKDLQVTAKFKPMGVSTADIDAKLALQNSANAAIGSSLNARGEDLIITGTGVYVMLRGAAAISQGIEFGMDKLRNGEVSVQATRTFTDGAANALAFVGTAAPE